MRRLPNLGWLPDSIIDTTRRRNRAAQQKQGDGVKGLAPRIHRACGPDLLHIVIPIQEGITGVELYNPTTNQTARKAVQAALDNAPAWCKLERGINGLLHAHIITGAHARLSLPPGSRVGKVHNMLGLLRYLSKPADSRACAQQDETGKYRLPHPSALEAAARDHQKARLKWGRLPRQSWTHQLPR